MYFIKWTNLVQSCLSGSRTLVVKNMTEVQVSGLALMVANKVLATKLWNSTALFGWSFSQSWSTVKRFSGTALDFVPAPFGSALSKAVRI
jgi:hypothetical protein